MKKPINRKVYKVNAENRIVGRLASDIAILLRGKHKVSYQPNVDAGDIVEVRNFDKVRFSGAKSRQKKYYRHSGYPGGLKSESAKEKMKSDPKFILWNAVWRMLPKNKLRTGMIKRLKFIETQ